MKWIGYAHARKLLSQGFRPNQTFLKLALSTKWLLWEYWQLGSRVLIRNLNGTVKRWNSQISPTVNVVKICIEDRFTIADGHPTFNKKWTDPMNAKQFAAEMVKHTYRKGWTLPDMPA